LDVLFNAIGFSDEKQFLKLFEETRLKYDKKHTLNTDNEITYVEYFKEFGKNFGICVIGTIDDSNGFILEKSFPYFSSDKNILFSYLEYYEPTENEFYVYIEEDETGNELVFKLLNFFENKYYGTTETDLQISGLSLKGTIILPLEKDEESELEQSNKWKYISDLQKRAREGDEIAKQLLLEEKEDSLLDIIRNNLLDDDFFSVVDSFFMGLDEDDIAYSILGDILEVTLVTNSITLEECFILYLNVTGTKFEIIINRNSLTGFPFKGMRFIGNCFLQGSVSVDSFV
jgi:hypothetical protein